MKFEDVERGYGNLWTRAEIRPDRRELLQTIARRLASKRHRYETVAQVVGCPWYWIAITHQRESGADFTRHLHNGDPLTARTRRVPAGRPPGGKPPFTWEQSALDALLYKGLDKIRDWPVARCLYEFERYNGFGYFARGVNSPYLWSFTTLYDKGKYVADGKYDGTAVDKQAGAAALLKAMVEIDAISLEQRRETTMTDLNRALQIYTRVAPTLVETSQTQPGLALQALAEKIEGDVRPEPDQVLAALNGITGLGAIVRVLQAADALLEEILPVQAPAPATPIEEVPVNNPEPTSPEIMTGFDKIFGQGLAGYKTYIGLAIFGLASILEILLPGGIGILTPALIVSAKWLGGVLAGAAAVSKAERWLKWFREIKTTAPIAQVR